MGTVVYAEGESENPTEEVTEKSIEDCEITVNDVTYTGKTAKPKVVVSYEGTTLVENTDYTITCQDVNVGEATVTVKGIGDYTGEVTKDFTIAKKNIKSYKASVENQVYTGEKLKPTVTVKGLTTKDYSVTYANNLNVGTATVTINGKGNYTGTLNTTFKITRKSIKSYKASVKNQVYTGKKLKPTVTVKGLTVKTDYIVTAYEKNLNVGTATVTIKGTNNYTGTLTATFKITRKDISNYKASVKDQIYTGEKLEPTVTVKNLKKSDYTVTYKSNKSIGDATVTVKGTGNYKGTINTTFKILPAQVTGLKVVRNGSTATLSWSKVKGAKGYTVYKYNPDTKTYKEYTSLSTNSLTIKKLSTSKTYYYAVKAYGGKYSSASYSKKVKAAKVPSKVTLKSAAFSGSTSISVTWKKVSCSGYEVDYSTNSNFKSKKTVKVTTTSATLKNISSSKTYYVRVRAYNTSDNSTTYGSYSAKKSIKASGYNSVYASYSTTYSGNADRETNLKLACKEINGTVLNPGDTFSFNKVVGTRTAEKGYKNAHIFSGNSVISGIGGGICQVASTVFNAALLANFEFTERSQHSQRVAYVPLGRDAAIYWGSKDLKFTNTSDYKIKILASAGGGVVSIKFMAYGDGTIKAPKVSLHVSQSGNTFTLTRKVNGKVNYTTRSTY
jgi:vancomycin resistance protein YoaR